VKRCRRTRTRRTSTPWPWLALLGLVTIHGSQASASMKEGEPEGLQPGEEPIALEVPSVSTSPSTSSDTSSTALPEMGETSGNARPTALPETGEASGGISRSDDPAEILVNANRAYEATHYPQAIEFYNQVLATGAGDGRVFYNLGNGYLRNGQLGHAIAAYRRAAALRPRDQEIAANLAFARKSTRNDLAPPSPTQLQRTLFFWHYRLSRAELLHLLVLTNLSLWLFFALRRLHRQSEVLRWLSMVALVLVMALGSSLALRLARPARVAVVVPQEITAHSGNDAKTVVRFKLQTGAEIRLVERRTNWLRIELPDGQQGWIESQHAEVVVEG